MATDVGLEDAGHLRMVEQIPAMNSGLYCPAQSLKLQDNWCDGSLGSCKWADVLRFCFSVHLILQYLLITLVLR